MDSYSLNQFDMCMSTIRLLFMVEFVGMYVNFIQYSQRGTFINPLTPVVRIIHAQSNIAAEHPLTLVVMTLAFRDDRTRGFAVVAREGSSRSTVFHRLHNVHVHVNCIK